jgi:predicted  nucleic acid-binding Zn-ribbon protein
MSIELAATIFGFLATIGGFVFYFGQLDVRIKNMEQRSTEDRQHNASEHSEFYAVKNEVTQITTQFTDFDRRMSSIEDSLKEILSRLPNRRTSNV